ncbi:MAG: hypothetical protein AAF944_24720 [Bacteroidota bacterium]
MLRRVIFLLLFLFSTESIAQENETLTNRKWGFFAGYNGFRFGNFGLQIGAENYLATARNFQIIGISSLQFYTQKEVQSGIDLNFRFGQRFTANYGVLLESYIGLGVAHTTYSSPTIDFTTTTGDSSVTKSSKWGVKPNITLGIGYDFNRKLDLSLITYARTNISWLYPDRNLVFQTIPFLEVGIVIMPKLKQKKSY